MSARISKVLPGGEVAATNERGASEQPRWREFERGGFDGPSEDAVALEFVEMFDGYRYVAPWHCWLRWDGKRWGRDSTGNVFECIRNLVRAAAHSGLSERSTANAGFVSGVEQLLRRDQRIVVLPEHLDADPWLLNTMSGIVDLRTGHIRPHDPNALCTRLANAPVDHTQGADLWATFMRGISEGDDELVSYLQRVAGYVATGVTTEDALVYLFGNGSNGKSSFAEAIAHALGDYARVFQAEVLLESKGERHPTDLAQFRGVRFALTSEPSVSATWNDSRIKSLTGDATIAARFMRGDFFEFARTHKTMIVGNHMPRLGDVSHAIRRRMQMVPFRAVFEHEPGTSVRERLKTEAAGAVLAWIVQGAQQWIGRGTSPPASVRALTDGYMSEQDTVGRWLDERCERVATAFEQSSCLYGDYVNWCRAQQEPAKSNILLSRHLESNGFAKAKKMTGNVFVGLKLKPAMEGMEASPISPVHAHTQYGRNGVTLHRFHSREPGRDPAGQPQQSNQHEMHEHSTAAFK